MQQGSTTTPSVFPGLHESLKSVLAERLGWTELREVQERAYRAIAQKNDVLVLAPTAGGKSEAALIPVVDDILKSGAPGVACIYLSPLKALINDQEERIAAFARPTGLSLAKWHGDVPKGGRGWKESEAPQFLLITPESLEVLLHEKDLRADLANLRYVIADELHAFVESERGVQMKVLLDRLDRIARQPVQRIGLSATVGNPEEVLAWFSPGAKKKQVVAVPALPAEKRFRFVVEPDPARRIDALARLVAKKKALVFVNSRAGAEEIVQQAAGIIPNLSIHHSSVSAAKKKEAEAAFHSDDGACIVCTSTLELGIDIGDLDIVVQAGPPDSVSSFLQRMGRAGRRDRPANVAWLLSDPRELLTSCAILECAREKQVEPLVPLQKPYAVLVQQLFLYVAAAKRAGRGTLARDLLALPAFAGITGDEFDRILAYLTEGGYLDADGDIILPGPALEREFGRSNYRDLYSVIAGGGEYRAVTPEGEPVGMVDARFARRENPGDFALGGSTWSVVKCDESHGLVVVVPGGGGTRSGRIFTSPGEEASLSPVIAGAVQRIAARGASTLPLGEAEQEILAAALHNFPEGLPAAGLALREEKGTAGKAVVVYSFHGSRFNRVLAYLLRGRLKKTEVRYDDERVRVFRAGKEGATGRVADAIREIAAAPPGEAGAFLPLPAPAASKFARCLPEDLIRRQALADYYRLDGCLAILGSGPVTVLPGPDQFKRTDRVT
ncbi:DEAD/DEAH box helicase [Methanoregula sp. UBA64]|uniref:DEAD/DEAH box helicase n=1 Tax=Methanoregula sp. UBA64 TaxID=1915554 RepID=UPI0025DF0AC7|nr:DEAD/DEAH box helicase [Methanoregula sp. UBA64]